LETLPSSSASCSRDSFLLVLCESVVTWVLRIVDDVVISNLSRRPGWLRLQPLRYATGSEACQLSEKYEISSLFVLALRLWIYLNCKAEVQSDRAAGRSSIKSLDLELGADDRTDWSQQRGQDGYPGCDTHCLDSQVEPEENRLH